MTKTHIAGFVGAFPIPEVMMAIDAFTQGMRSVDPKAEVHVVWVNSWFDPGKEREATMSLISQGADMITQHTDSTVVVQTVEEQHKAKNVWCFSYNSDMSKYAPPPSSAATSPTGPATTPGRSRTCSPARASGPTSGRPQGGHDQDRPLQRAVPKPVRAYVDKVMAEMKAGKVHAFQGP